MCFLFLPIVFFSPRSTQAPWFLLRSCVFLSPLNLPFSLPSPFFVGFYLPLVLWDVCVWSEGEGGSALGALSCALTFGHFEIVVVEVLHSLCRASFLLALIIL